jgi:hypothetical protein
MQQLESKKSRQYKTQSFSYYQTHESMVPSPQLLTEDKLQSEAPCEKKYIFLAFGMNFFLQTE